MHCNYQDILSRIPEAPLWWDENAVPRFCPFSPEEIANIYAEQCALILIQCQNCKTPFQVSVSFSQLDILLRQKNELADVDLIAQIHHQTLHYGDPPNIGCCPSGPTMNCEDIKVLEFWQKVRQEKKFPLWQRDHTLEIPLADYEEKNNFISS